MPKNLEEKISLLLKEIETMEHSAKVRTVKRFIENEMLLSEETLLIDIYDLTEIKSRAVAISLDCPPEMTVSGQRLMMNTYALNTMSYVKAIWEFFRRTGLTKYNIDFKKDK